MFPLTSVRLMTGSSSQGIGDSPGVGELPEEKICGSDLKDIENNPDVLQGQHAIVLRPFLHSFTRFKFIGIYVFLYSIDAKCASWLQE